MGRPSNYVETNAQNPNYIAPPQNYQNQNYGHQEQEKYYIYMKL